MNKIGIIGGMSFESTLHYYDMINQQVNERTGGLASADLAIRSVNFDAYYKLMQEYDWESITSKLSYEAAMLDAWCNCRYIAIASNTMHKAARRIEEDLALDAKYSGGIASLVHIGDCVAEKCLEAGIKRVALIGTRFTMQEDFMKERLKDNELEVVNDFSCDTIKRIDHIIYDELCHGIIESVSAEFLEDLCQSIAETHKIEGIILGCTELGMILKGQFSHRLAKEYGVSLFDTAQAHIDKLVNLCLSDGK